MIFTIILILIGLILIGFGYIEKLNFYRNNLSEIDCQYYSWSLLKKNRKTIREVQYATLKTEEMVIGIPIILITKNSKSYVMTSPLAVPGVSFRKFFSHFIEKEKAKKVEKINNFIKDSNQKQLKIKNDHLLFYYFSGCILLLFGIVTLIMLTE